MKYVMARSGIWMVFLAAVGVTAAGCQSRWERAFHQASLGTPFDDRQWESSHGSTQYSFGFDGRPGEWTNYYVIKTETGVVAAKALREMKKLTRREILLSGQALKELLQVQKDYLVYDKEGKVYPPLAHRESDQFDPVQLSGVRLSTWADLTDSLDVWPLMCDWLELGRLAPFYANRPTATSRLTIAADGVPMTWDRLLSEINRDASVFKEIRITEIIPNDATVRFIRQ